MIDDVLRGIDRLQKRQAKILAQLPQVRREAVAAQIAELISESRGISEALDRIRRELLLMRPIV